MKKRFIFFAGATAAAILSTAWFWPVAAAETPLFSITVLPQLPFAGDEVKLEVVPQNFEIASTTITWSRGGVPLPSASGRGRGSLTVDTDASRSEIIRITADVDPEGDFSSASQSATIYTVPNPLEQQRVIENIASDFTLEVSNANPNPGEMVDVSVVTFAFDKETAFFEWRLDNRSLTEASGRGKYRLSIPAGEDDESKTVSATVTTPSGVERTKTLTIKTVSAALYWWADTTVPYWYKGKALPSLNSRVTVMALTNNHDADELNYQWQFNDAVIPAASGFGRPTFSLPLALPVGERVDATVKDAFGTLNKSAGLVVEPIRPSVGIYEMRPLIGQIFEKQAVNFTAPPGGVHDFIAEPFFFPLDHKPDLDYRWAFNNQKITGGFDRPWLFTVRSNRGETSLDNQLDLELSDPAKGSERALTSTRISFR